MKKLLLGNEAVARGLYEAGVKVVSSYPGTPSTEITENVAKYDEIYCEWAPNEKVAFEVASGASIAGVRSFCAMKHVGLNVAADPLYTMSYIGVKGGFVCAVADDPGMHSSQNEQDSRRHAIGAKVPMLEPSDSEECVQFTRMAYELSEKYDTPVLLRLSTRISHSRSLAELSEREERETVKYEKDIMKNVMMPAMARPRHAHVEKRMAELAAWGEDCPVNKVEYYSRKRGFICAGTTYNYAKEAFGEDASYLKLGMVNPLPINIIKSFAAEVDELYVVEELDSVIEDHCLKNGVKVIGKQIFSMLGEFSQATVKAAVDGTHDKFTEYPDDIPARPPVLCAGCPHRGFYYAIKEFSPYVSGDIGCYTLGASAPLSGVDACICMGASVSALHGYNKALGIESKNSLAVIGDSTFIHSGITGLIDIVYNKGFSTVVVLDNSITGMTGHQNNPANGKTIRGDVTTAVDIEALGRAIGINRITVVDPFDVENVRKVVKEEMESGEVSLIISRRPCALLKGIKHPSPLKVNDKCVGCKLCLNCGCPAISVKNDENGKRRAVIDPNQCLGCGVCAYACKLGAIER